MQIMLKNLIFSGFLKKMCEASELAIIHVCEDLTKFGYMLERKSRKV